MSCSSQGEACENWPASRSLEGPLWLLGRNGLVGQRGSGGEPCVAAGARGPGRAGTGPRTRPGRTHLVGADLRDSRPWPAPHSAPLTYDGDLTTGNAARRHGMVGGGSPRSPAACPGGTPARSWWPRSPRRPGSRDACGHRSPPSARRPPGRGTRSLAQGSPATFLGCEWQGRRREE